MSRRINYRADFADRPGVPRGLWLLLCATLVCALLLGGYLSFRQPEVEELQARLLSRQLLPGPATPSAAPDPLLQRRYAEVIQVSKALSLPVQDWLNCLTTPPDASLLLNGFDWSAASDWMELRLTANSRDEAQRYLEGWQGKDSACNAAVTQEERNATGGIVLNLKLRPRMGATAP
ncbi:hypothetical protein D9M69_428220 [compost metagenome]